LGCDNEVCCGNRLALEMASIKTASSKCHLS
jgi:hypothetical protein